MPKQDLPYQGKQELNTVVPTYLNWPYLASQFIQFHTQPTHTHTHTHTHTQKQFSEKFDKDTVETVWTSYSLWSIP